MELKELLESLVRALVDHPEEVIVREVKGDKTLILELRVNKNDMGQVIGKKGRTAQAIRTILNEILSNVVYGSLVNASCCHPFKPLF